MGFKSKLLCGLFLCFTICFTNKLVTSESIQLSQLLDMQNVQRVQRDSETRATSRSCGGVLQSGDTGEISFNPLSSVGANLNTDLSCVWIIYVQGSSSIHLNVTESFFVPGERDVFQYGYFNNSNYQNEEDFVWKSFEKMSPDSSTVKGPIVFIHLATYGRSPSLGFNLIYKANGTLLTDHLYMNMHTSENYGVTKFSPESVSTNSSLRYIYVIQPTLASTSVEKYRESLYFLRMKLLEGKDNCIGNETDIISVYRWRSSWNKVQGYCGSQTKTQTGIQFSTEEGRNDPLIITFKSDSKILTKSKFEFFWNYHNGAATFLPIFYTPLLLFSAAISAFTKFLN